MGRFVSILLLLLLGLPSVAPMFAAGGVRETDLPACCRRAGAHHCAMGMGETAPRERAWRAMTEPCPFRTQVRSAPLVNPLFAAPVHRVGALPVPALAGVVAQASAARRVARERIRQKRGPPFFLS